MQTMLRILGVAALALAVSDASAQKVIRAVPHSDLASLEPMVIPAQINRIYSYMVYDTLFALDSKLEAKPMMLESHRVSADGLTYTFTLRSGLKFHDGMPVGAKDVVASLERWLDRTSVGARMKALTAGLQAEGDRTVIIKMKEPYGLVEYSLAGAASQTPAVLPEAQARAEKATNITVVNGSGPFKFVQSEWQTGHRVVFAKNPDYIPRAEAPDGLAGGRHVKVDRVEWHILPDPGTTANALIAGEVDFWDTASLDMVPRLEANPNITVRRTVLMQNAGWIRPNFTVPPFNDVRARKALLYLLDQSELMTAVAGDKKRWSTCHSFSVCGSPLGTETGSEPYRQRNPERAKQLLAEAGYKGEPIIVLGTTTLPPINAMVQVTAQRLREIGVNVDLQIVDWGVQLQRMSKPLPIGQGGFHILATYSIGANHFHPLTNSAFDTSCRQTNFAGWPCDEEMEKLRVKVLTAPDPAAVKAANEVYQKQLWDFVPYVPAGLFDVVNAYRKNLTGVLDSNLIAFWNIEKN
jgi:peptide/nickel transport system substrate-binding protein